MAPFKKKPSADIPEPAGTSSSDRPGGIPEDLFAATANLSDDDFDLGVDLSMDEDPAASMPPEEPAGTSAADAAAAQPIPSGGIAPDLLEATANLSDDDFDLGADPEGDAFSIEPSGPPEAGAGAATRHDVPPRLGKKLIDQRQKNRFSPRTAFLLGLLGVLLLGGAGGWYWLNTDSGIQERISAGPGSEPPDAVMQAASAPAVPEETAAALPAKDDSGKTAETPGSAEPRDDLIVVPAAEESAYTKPPRSASAETVAPSEPPPEITPAAISTVTAQDAGEPQEHADRARQQESYDYYVYMGSMAEQRGSTAEAIDAYQRAARIRPQEYRLHNKIGYILIGMSLYEEALHFIEKALQLNDTYVPALVNRGIIAAQMGELEEAEKYLRDALVLDVTSSSALYNLMLVCKKARKFECAQSCRSKLNSLGVSLAE